MGASQVGSIQYIENNMDPDQTAPMGTLWSGFIVYASI